MLQQPKRLNLLDAMLLVAAIAIGLIWSQYQRIWSWNPLDSRATEAIPLISLDNAAWLATSPRSRPVAACIVRTSGWLGVAAPSALLCAIMLLAITLRGPGPVWRLRLRQPGAAACAATVLALGLGVIRVMHYAIHWYETVGERDARGYAHPWTWNYNPAEFLNPSDIGLCITATWVALYLSGSLRPNRSALDVLGCVLGIYWIVLMFLSWVRF